MSKKSLFYIAGGALLILWAVLSLVEGAMGMLGYPPLKMFFKMHAIKQYMHTMTFMSWFHFAVWILAGGVLIAKAFVPDMLPNIAIAGLFALLALFALVGFVGDFFALFRGGNARYFVNWIRVFSALLSVVAVGGMAVIIFLKDSFGSLFFVPAAAVAAKAFMWFIIRAFGLFGMFSLSFGVSLILLLIDCVLVAALFAVGMANNEE